MRARRSVLMLVFAAVASVLLASSAWAWCSPSTNTSPFPLVDGTAVAVSPSATEAGTQVQVEGQNWAPGYVEARWDSATGPVLAASWVTSASEYYFGVNAAIPAGATPGWHQIVAVHWESPPPPGAGAPPADARKATTPFQVLAGPGSSTPTTLGTGSLTGTASGAQPAGRTTTSAPVTGSTGVPSQMGASPSQSRPAQGNIATTNDGTPLLASSVLSGLSGLVGIAPSSAPTPAAQGEPAADVGSPASVLGELWQGFEAGRTPLSPSSLNNLPPTRDPLQQTTSLLILLPVGLLSVIAGFAASDMRRRRALAAG